MTTFIPTRTAFVLLLCGLILVACDQGAPANSAPAFDSLQADEDLLHFRPDEDPPSVTVTASVSDPEDDEVSFSWTASGGYFHEIDDPTTTSSSSISWTPDPLAGSYEIAVSVSDGEMTSRDTLSIDVRPDLRNVWQGSISLENEEYEEAHLCLFMTSSLQTYGYEESRSGTGTTGFGTGGSPESSTYDYPLLNAVLSTGDSDTRDEPLTLWGRVNAEGTVFEVDVKLESGMVRNFTLERVVASCS